MDEKEIKDYHQYKDKLNNGPVREGKKTALQKAVDDIEDFILKLKVHTNKYVYIF